MLCQDVPQGLSAERLAHWKGHHFASVWKACSPASMRGTTCSLERCTGVIGADQRGSKGCVVAYVASVDAVERVKGDSQRFGKLFALSKRIDSCLDLCGEGLWESVVVLTCNQSPQCGSGHRRYRDVDPSMVRKRGFYQVWNAVWNCLKELAFVAGSICTLDNLEARDLKVGCVSSIHPFTPTVEFVYGVAAVRRNVVKRWRGRHGQRFVRVETQLVSKGPTRVDHTVKHQRACSGVRGWHGRAGGRRWRRRGCRRR